MSHRYLSLTIDITVSDNDGLADRLLDLDTDNPITPDEFTMAIGEGDIYIDGIIDVQDYGSNE